MDARRLGMGADLPQAFLEAAATGYLTDAECYGLGEDWLEQALVYTAKLCWGGVRGPLTRILPRPARSGARESVERLTDCRYSTPGGPLYRLADYLDQYGRAHRGRRVAPGGVLVRRYHAAAPGRRPEPRSATSPTHAVCTGTLPSCTRTPSHPATSAPLSTSAIPRPVCADPRPARWAASHAPLDDPAALVGTA